MQEREKKKVSVISIIILMIAIGVFLFSGYQLYKIYIEYRIGAKEYTQIKKSVIKETIVKDEETGEKRSDFIVDFEALKALNEETVGWIRFDEPQRISYPVVQGVDNSKYLRTTFEEKKNAVGAIFLDVGNAVDFSDRNTFIYGHNMKDRSMFGELRNFKNAEFCEQNPYFYIYTPDGREIQYLIFAVKVVGDTAGEYRRQYANDADFSGYIRLIRTGSLYSPNVEVGPSDRIVSLSTCTNVREDERLLVHGVKINERMIGE